MILFENGSIPDRTRAAVNSAVRLQRLPQSIMLTSGVRELREKCSAELSMAALCRAENAPCGVCPCCKKILHGVHPDVIRVLPDSGRKTLSIENVRRQVISTLSAFPNEADGKIYIFPDADSLSEVVQNALLKSIEEPPDNVMFIFECEKRESMLSTVISRLTEYYLGGGTQSAAPENGAQSIAAGCAMAAARDDEFRLMLSTAPMKKNRALMSDTAKRIILIVRDALSCGSRAEQVSGEPAAAAALAAAFGEESLIKIKCAMEEIISDAAANANENLLITRFSSLLAVIMRERRS